MFLDCSLFFLGGFLGVWVVLGFCLFFSGRFFWDVHWFGSWILSLVCFLDFGLFVFVFFFFVLENLCEVFLSCFFHSFFFFFSLFSFVVCVLAFSCYCFWSHTSQVLRWVCAGHNTARRRFSYG